MGARLSVIRPMLFCRPRGLPIAFIQISGWRRVPNRAKRLIKRISHWVWSQVYFWILVCRRLWRLKSRFGWSSILMKLWSANVANIWSDSEAMLSLMSCSALLSGNGNDITDVIYGWMSYSINLMAYSCLRRDNDYTRNHC